MEAWPSTQSPLLKWIFDNNGQNYTKVDIKVFCSSLILLVFFHFLSNILSRVVSALHTSFEQWNILWKISVFKKDFHAANKTSG